MKTFIIDYIFEV